MIIALPRSEIILYQREDGRTRVQCRFENESVWLTQKLMADLFQIGVGTVNHYLKTIFAEGELQPGATIRRYRIVQSKGARQTARYHALLDAQPRRVDAEFEKAAKELKKLPGQKKPKPPNP